MNQLLVTLAIGLLGGLIASGLKLPAGGLIGAMLAVGLFNIFNNDGIKTPPRELMFLGQVLIGIFIGLGITKAMVFELKNLFLPAVALVVLVTATGVFTGFVIYKLTDLDIGTALFSGSPGGITNMAIIAEEMGVNAKVVAYMQLIRVLALVIIQPLILKFVWSLGFR